MPAALADVTEWLSGHCGDRIPLPTIARLVRRAKHELEIATEPALSELVERLERDHA